MLSYRRALEGLYSAEIVAARLPGYRTPEEIASAEETSANGKGRKKVEVKLPGLGEHEE